VNAVQTIAVIAAAFGGLGGLATSLRARAQNRRDDAGSRRENAEADSIAVETARDLIAQVRDEMDRRVLSLTRDMERLERRLDSALADRDRLRAEVDHLRDENRTLKARLEAAEERVREVTAALVRERARRERAGAPPAQ
jgi:septal ring factor EnvC (AmiA/AmiB activator)